MKFKIRKLLAIVLFFNGVSAFGMEIDSIAVDTTTPKQGFFHRVLNQDKPVTFVVAPLISYTPETNFQFGAGGLIGFRIKNDSATPSSFITPWFTYSINHQIISEVFGSFFIDGKKHQIDYELGYLKLKLPYFGNGNEHSLKEKESFYHGNFRFWSNYHFRIKESLLIGARYHLEYTHPIEYESGKLLETEQPLGFEGGVINGVGLRLGFDNRDDVYFPYKGNFAMGSATYYPSFLGSRYNFSILTAEYKSFINIKRKVILASHILAQVSTGETPFYMLPRLGGRNVLRGYLDGAYRDKFLFNLQGELRVPIHRIVLTGFFGSGRVGSEIKDLFGVKGYHYSIGAGARVRPFPKKNLTARLDFGFWQGTYGFYFVFNEAF